LVQGVGGVGYQPAGILQYDEDLKAGTNTQIGPKDFFEMASRLIYPAAEDCLSRLALYSGLRGMG